MLLARKVKVVTLEQQDLLEHLEHWVHLALLEHLEVLDNKEVLVHLDNKVRKETVV